MQPMENKSCQVKQIWIPPRMMQGHSNVNTVYVSRGHMTWLALQYHLKSSRQLWTYKATRNAFSWQEAVCKCWLGLHPWITKPVSLRKVTLNQLKMASNSMSLGAETMAASGSFVNYPVYKKTKMFIKVSILCFLFVCLVFFFFQHYSPHLGALMTVT